MNTVEIFNLDAQDFMAKIPDQMVDVIVTDPPYWTLDKWRAIGTTTRLGGNRNADDQRPEMFFETIDQDYLWECIGEFSRILKSDGHLYVFCDDIVAPILLNWIREAETGFEDAHMLIWDKVNMGMGYHYRHVYECIIFAWKKGKRRLADLGMPDLFRDIKRITGGYPTQKPAALVSKFITQSARPGDVLCDPFAGSGVLAEATPPGHNCQILLNDKAMASQQWMLEHLKGKAMLLGLGDSIQFRGENAGFQYADGALRGRVGVVRECPGLGASEPVSAET